MAGKLWHDVSNTPTKTSHKSTNAMTGQPVPERDHSNIACLSGQPTAKGAGILGTMATRAEDELATVRLSAVIGLTATGDKLRV